MNINNFFSGHVRFLFHCLVHFGAVGCLPKFQTQINMTDVRHTGSSMWRACTCRHYIIWTLGVPELDLTRGR